MKNLFQVLLISSILFCVSIKAEFKKESPTNIRYYYLGSYKALMGIPSGKGPFPVVIYSYDEFYDWAGEKLANKIGYNIEDIASFFVKKGYVCVIPVDRFRKVNAIIGIAKYLERKKYIDKTNMHLVGLSEGAFLNYIATFKYPFFRSMTCIGPISINDKGHLSLYGNILKEDKNNKIPVLFIMIRDVGWRINEQSKVYKSFKIKFNSVTLKTYYKEKRWFWDMNHAFSNDINNFIQNQYNHHHDTSKNTYKPIKY